MIASPTSMCTMMLIIVVQTPLCHRKRMKKNGFEVRPPPKLGGGGLLERYYINGKSVMLVCNRINSVSIYIDDQFHYEPP
jgi:hypothetical protein